MSNEAKVGIFTVVALSLLVGIILYLSGFSINRDTGYKFQIRFNQVTGLKIGANVNYVGINIGKVEKINIDDNEALVTVKINDNTKIDRKSIFTINTEGLMGEKFISILPPENTSQYYVASGDIVDGVDEHGLDYMMQMASTTILQLQDLIKSMNNVLGNKDVQDSMIQTAMNLRDLTKNMNNLMLVMSNIAINNEGNINNLLSNLSYMSESMGNAASELERLIHNFSGDGQYGTYLKEAVENLSKTSASVRKMAENMEPILGDPQTAQDIKNIIENANNISRRADSMMGKLSNIKTSTGIEGVYDTKNRKLNANIDMKIFTDDKSFVKLGVDGLGSDSTTNAQIGQRSGKLDARAGLVDSKLGAGFDYNTGRSIFSFEAYNPKSPTFNIKGQQKLNDDTYLVGQIKNVNNADNRKSYVGIRKEF